MLVIIFLATLIKISCSNDDVNYDVSTSDLANLVKTKHFVDKSDIIKVFFQATPMTMITAPRRFGKSTNMDMIKRFCEITVDGNGIVAPVHVTNNYELFTTNNLSISKDGMFFNSHFGKYPVIYLDFKRLSCGSYTKFLSSFKEMIYIEFRNYYYLLNSRKLNKLQIVELERFYNKIYNYKLSETDLEGSLSFLSELLFTHFDKIQCIVLIDEYDGPIQEAIFKSGSDLTKIMDFILKFISISLKSNRYVGRALINACVRLGGVLTTDANNIQHIPFLANNEFYTFYGFTEEEVKSLLENTNMSDTMDNVNKWYNGYSVENSDIKIYNPYSIVNYLKSKKFKNYWIQSGNMKNLKKIFLNKKISRIIDKLLDTSTATITEFDRIDVEHIAKLKEVVNKPQACELSKNDAYLFMQFMTDLGYFNIVYRGDKKVIVGLPNLEIKKEIERVLYTVSFFKEKLKTNSKNIKSYVSSLLELGENETTFIALANSVASLHSNLAKMPENEYHFLHALCAFPDFSEKFQLVESEVTTVTRKRIDLLIIRHDLTAIIIELKYDKESGYKALKQIISNGYIDMLDHKYKFLHVKNYILVGLYASKNKRCDISYTVNSADIMESNNVTAFPVITNQHFP